MWLSLPLIVFGICGTIFGIMRLYFYKNLRQSRWSRRGKITVVEKEGVSNAAYSYMSNVTSYMQYIPCTFKAGSTTAHNLCLFMCVEPVYAWNRSSETSTRYIWSAYMVPDIWSFFMVSLIRVVILCTHFVHYLTGAVTHVKGKMMSVGLRLMDRWTSKKHCRIIRISNTMKLVLRKEGVDASEFAIDSETTLQFPTKLSCFAAVSTGQARSKKKITIQCLALYAKLDDERQRPRKIRSECS